ncbi:hypothetical protein [Micromonospora sediminicola]|uniref:hypothetical protein n=1 Tax=Micromonospora sediminicola TaxID=946078 RepID=UPI003791B305
MAGLSDLAYRVCSEAIFWCARNLTDGVIRAHEVDQIHPKARRAADVLVERDLWHHAGDVERCPSCVQRLAEAGRPIPPDGYVVHDLLEYQPSRAKVMLEREAKAERQQRWREKKRGGKRDGDVDAPVDASRDASTGGGGTSDRNRQAGSREGNGASGVTVSRPSNRGGNPRGPMHTEGAPSSGNASARRHGDASVDAPVDALVTPTPYPTPSPPRRKRGRESPSDPPPAAQRQAPGGGSNPNTTATHPPSSTDPDNPDWRTRPAFGAPREPDEAQRARDRAAAVRAAIPPRRPTTPTGPSALDRLAALAEQVTAPPEAS